MRCAFQRTRGCSLEGASTFGGWVSQRRWDGGARVADGTAPVCGGVTTTRPAARTCAPIHSDVCSAAGAVSLLCSSLQGCFASSGNLLFIRSRHGGLHTVPAEHFIMTTRRGFPAPPVACCCGLVDRRRCSGPFHTNPMAKASQSYAPNTN